MNIASLLERKYKKEQLSLLKDVSAFSKGLNLSPYMVGGAVRDILMSRLLRSKIGGSPSSSGKFPVQQDIDIVICGEDVGKLAGSLAEKWKAGLVSYADFMTYTLELPDGLNVDLITARKETYPKPAALPHVEKSGLEDDLLRRDFSINAIALSLSEENWGEIKDLTGGLADLKKRSLKILHDKSFADDPTRIFRMARYAGRFGLKIEEHTAKLLACSVNNRHASNLSADRIRVEMEKILGEKEPGKALALLGEWGILKEISPEVAWNYCLPAGRAKADNSLAFRLSLALAGNSLKDSQIVIKRLKFPSDVQDRVMQSLEIYNSLTSGKPANSLPRQNVFAETADFLKTAPSKDKSFPKRRSDYLFWLECSPLLDGQDLKIMGYAPGPPFKKILDALANARYEGKIKTRAQEMRFVIDNFRRE